MKNKTLLIGAVIFAVLPLHVWAADVFGTWIARAPGNLEMTEIIFNFRVDGKKLEGDVSGPQGKTAISDGRINGDEISFSVVWRFVGNERKLTYKGKVGLNEIKFTVRDQNGTGRPQEFVAEREFQRNQDIPLRPQFAPVRVPREEFQLPPDR